MPGDCADGFLGALWLRPQAYLDPASRAAMSGMALLDQDAVTTAWRRRPYRLAKIGAVPIKRSRRGLS